MVMNLSEEIRDGFVVTEERKRIWKSQLEMLAELKRVCDKHNICFFAVAGTMLGAVRHKGYIPWDDDVDLALRREDYNKLLEVGPQEIQYPFFFQTALTEEDYYSPLVRIRDSRTTAIIRSGSHDDWGRRCNNGIYLDIFPLDGYIENSFLRRIQFIEIRGINMIMRERVYEEKGKLGSSIRHRILKRAVNKKMLERLYRRYNVVCSRYSYKTEKVALLAGSVYNKAYYWDYEDIHETVYVPFEDTEIPIPKGYDKCLKVQYGDYMKLPPIEKRGAHHSEAVIFNPYMNYKEYQRTHSKNGEDQ